VVKRRFGDSRAPVRIDGLHEVDLHRERADAGAEDVFFDVFAREPVAARRFETQKVHPELGEARFVRASERNLLHSENAERSRLAQ
jgi:hypothetical protein